MASSIVPQLAGAQNTLPSSIHKIEHVDGDQYNGPLVDLLASGLIREDQLPPPGKDSISYAQGRVVHRNHRKDETCLRISYYQKGKMAMVLIGVSREVARARRAAVDAERRAQRASQLKPQRQAQAEMAAETLKQMPKSAGEYRRTVVGSIRAIVESIIEQAARPSGWHGYRMPLALTESVLNALDPIVEQVMSAKVLFDAETHRKIEEEQRALVRAADPAFGTFLASLLVVNPSLLEGGRP